MMSENGPQTDTPEKVKFALPEPFAWIDIPAGSITLEDASHYPKPGTAGGTFHMDAFTIAKYPITNTQWRTFIQADDGYNDARWWEYSSAARAWHADLLTPKAAITTDDDLPRTNVCWYDALAFCRWLSHRTGQTITLPTEQQWQRAARGDEDRLYPWGKRFDRTRCNSSVDEKSEGPTPVTQHPDGASPYGVCDLVGNVWEWCLTMWGADSCDISVNEARMLMGGAWNVIYSYDMRSANRYRFYPTHEGNDIGFRIVRLPAPPPDDTQPTKPKETRIGGIKGLFGRGKKPE
jgi:formylglycine-generating enzyme required for sulfatase activity